jgi:orotidine-5'-phosphate decarboxylase
MSMMEALELRLTKAERKLARAMTRLKAVETAAGVDGATTTPRKTTAPRKATAKVSPATRATATRGRRNTTTTEA